MSQLPYVAQPAPTPPPARWATQVSIWQKTQPAFWLFMTTLAITGLIALSKQMTMIQVSPSAWFVTLLLLAPYAIPVTLFIYLIDMYEREPKGILIGALAWGGIAATTLSLYTNTPLDELLFKVGGQDLATSWGAALTAPFVEEGFKALGIILLVSMARAELDDILDGFVWGAMVGIGFLVVEDVFYFMNAFVAAKGDFGGLWQIAFIRIIGAGPYSHFLYTGLTGMGIAYYVTRTDKPWSTRLLFGIGLGALGVGAHFLWNSPLFAGIAAEGSLSSFLVYVTIKGLPLLIGLVVVVSLARSRDKKWFTYLAANPAIEGEISPADLNELGGLIRRWRARRAASSRKGPVGGRLHGLIQRQMVAMAITASHAAGPDDPQLLDQRRALRELRAQFEALPDAGAAAAAGAAAGQGVGGAGGWGAAGGWNAAAGQPATPGGAVAPSPIAAAWAPTGAIPPEGMPAWASPDPRSASVPLAGGLPVAVVERLGDWARVTASNGWTGWVDARRLV